MHTLGEICCTACRPIWPPRRKKVGCSRRQSVYTVRRLSAALCCRRVTRQNLRLSSGSCLKVQCIVSSPLNPLDYTLLIAHARQWPPARKHVANCMKHALSKGWECQVNELAMLTLAETMLDITLDPDHRNLCRHVVLPREDHYLQRTCIRHS